MSVVLVDVNVLIALLDRYHVQHEVAHTWFAALGAATWATCPLVENGVLRIMGSKRYPGSLGTPAAVAPALIGLRSHARHVFWADDLSLLTSEWVDPTRILDAAQVTDSYLLALARSKGSRLATFDRRLVTSAVRDGQRTLSVIG